MNIKAYSALSLSIAFVLSSGPVLAQNPSPPACDEPSTEPTEACSIGTDVSPEGERTSVSKAWWIGGLALLGAGAAGGGGGSDGGGPGPGPGPGGGSSQGGSYPSNSVMVSGDQQAHWTQHVHTQITGDNVRNEGTLTIDAGTLTVHGQGDLRNNGMIALATGTVLSIEGEGEINSYGSMAINGRLNLIGDGSLDNHGTLTAQNATFTLTGEGDIENAGTMVLQNSMVALSGDSEFDNGAERTHVSQLRLDGSRFTLTDTAEFENSGNIEALNLKMGDTLIDIRSQRLRDIDTIEAFDNYGNLSMATDARVLSLVAESHASLGINRNHGRISSNARGQAMIHAEGQHATFINQGTLTITGDNAIAMSAARGATLINDGVINLGIAGDVNGVGMVAMQSDGSAVLNNRVGGVININAGNSHAFKVTGTGTGRIINNGQVNISGVGSGLYFDTTTAANSSGGPDLGYRVPRGTIVGYTVGTNVDGSAGQMMLADGGYIAEVDVDTGFTRGTSASSVLLEDVFVGARGGENNIRSKTVVWEAQAQRDERGNVDVTMTRNNYADLVKDSLGQFATALDQGYTNNEVFHSLELENVAQLESAMKQLSGEGLTQGAQRAASSGQSFWSALDAQGGRPGLSVFGFTPGTRQGWSPQGQGGAMSLVTPRHSGSTDVRLGIMSDSHFAHSNVAGDSLRSNYLGMGWTRNMGGLQLRNAVSNEWHTLDTTRGISYGQTNRLARSQRQVARNVLSSTLSRDWNSGNLQLRPRVATQAYRHGEGAFKETGAGNFNLAVGSVTAFGMNLETGLAWQWSLNPRWGFSGDASLSKPLAHSGNHRSARLEGADQVEFPLPALRPDGLDHSFHLGVDYRQHAMRMNFGMRSQRTFGERADQVDLSLAFVF